MTELDSVLRSARPRAIAAVTRSFGDLHAAEDAVQEAMLRALDHWPRSGVPDSPEAWLIVTARRWLIDQSRRREQQSRYSRMVVPVACDDESEPDLSGLDDDLLRLVFACCHPALAEEARIALTLKVILGLSMDDVARAFLVAPRTMEQRLVRARRRLRDAGIGFEMPRDTDLPERLGSVLGVAYLVFNQGYSARDREQLIEVDLCAEAIRLLRLLARLYRGEPEILGLLALMLFQHSRHAARSDRDGDLVVLADQNRGLWDRDLIAEGHALLQVALRTGRPGPYQTQGAIAALHCEAATPDDTDWEQIVGLYEVLERQAPGPVVTLNRAVAVAHADDAQAALELLAGLEGRPEMQGYPPYHAAQAELSLMAGDVAEARAAWERAAEHSASEQERGYFRRRIDALG